MQKHLKNQVFTGSNGKKSVYDLAIPEQWNGILIIFLHGYMGYKDWGCWNLVSDYFTVRSFGFLKYNVSHNGGTLDNPIDFDDVESFSRNTYMREIEDFQAILAEVEKSFDQIPVIYLIGHSRGGGIALLQSDNGFVKKTATWAAISDIGSRFPSGKEFNAWREDGYYFKKNGRTNQQMPHHFSQYESFLANKDRLNIMNYCKNSVIPTLVIHGTHDTSVKPKEGKDIARWLDTDLILIENEQHTFGSSQPWEKDVLPDGLEQVCVKTYRFFEDIEEETDDLKERLSLISELVKLAKVDRTVRDTEYNFLLAIASQLGISRKNFERVFNEFIEFHPPKLELDRIVQFQRLILMMHVDSDPSEDELVMIKDLGMRMGLHPMAIEEVLKIKDQYINHIIPADRLIEIFKLFHN